ncbi:hypothetical protein AB4Z34_01520 [Ensifer sp. 2YAB10]|uniref:hypothetical protein n=1 Tax=unclassified Ensifer TaxID=2633371 RepID=UPI003F92C281
MQIGFTGLLGLLFIGLKLTGYIAWPWLWVLSPFWIAFAIWVVVFVGVLIFHVVTGGSKTRKS